MSLEASLRAVMILAIGLATVSQQGGAHAAELKERGDLAVHFSANKVIGTMAIRRWRDKHVIVTNRTRASIHYVPASTFKIANSLIALETKSVRDADEIIPYGGKPQRLKRWERDMSMREAIAMSNVPIYQEIARRVGLKRYKVWLGRLGYGNGKVGQIVEQFWLDGSLAISAVEQVEFIHRMVQGKLPISKRSISMVRGILKLEVKNGRTLYGKTGWCGSCKPKIGWWTGWIESRGKTTAFSLNMDLKKIAQAPLRISIGKMILTELGEY